MARTKYRFIKFFTGNINSFYISPLLNMQLPYEWNNPIFSEYPVAAPCFDPCRRHHSFLAGRSSHPFVPFSIQQMETCRHQHNFYNYYHYCKLCFCTSYCVYQRLVFIASFWNFTMGSNAAVAADDPRFNAAWSCWRLTWNRAQVHYQVQNTS